MLNLGNLAPTEVDIGGTRDSFRLLSAANADDRCRYGRTFQCPRDSHFRGAGTVSLSHDAQPFD
jgi:hypothetical protein